MLVLKLKFGDVRILFHYSEQEFSNWWFPVTKWMCVLFPLGVFGLEVWNDCHEIGVGFGAWQFVF